MKRRLQWAIALSVLLHAVAVGVWREVPPAPVGVPEVERPVFVELEFPVAPAPAQPAPVPAPAPVASKRSRVAQKPSEPVTKPSEAVVAVPEAATHDSPREVTLVPRTPVVEPVPEGRTIHNRPEELPDPAAVLAYEGEVVRGRVDGWVKTTLAQHRVANGVVSYYFHDLRKRLEHVTDNPPPFLEPFGPKVLPELGQQLAQGWATAAGRYGKTGVAYEESPGYRDLHGVAVSEAEKGGKQAREFQQKTEAAARFRDFGDGKMGEELFAVVEVRQGSDGSLVDLSLLQPSSSVRFDAWVMKQAPKAIDGLVAPPDAGIGIHADGMHSVWAFKGRVTYKRDLGDAKLLEDGWYVGLMAIPGLLTGNFDEVTGKVEYIDLRHPKYECRVQLLEVY